MAKKELAEIIDVVKNKKAGQPTKYNEKLHCQFIFALARTGATSLEMATAMEIHIDTIYEWRKVHKKFSEAFQKGRDEIDEEIEKTLFHRARGDIVTTETKVVKDKDDNIKETIITTKQIPPDPTCLIYWLKVRQKEKWGQYSKVVPLGNFIFYIPENGRTWTE